MPEYNSNIPDIEVLSLTQDARQVHIGSIFVAIPGTKVDGHQFLPAACLAGASAVIVEKTVGIPEDYKGYVQVVKNSREALDRLAAQFYSHPSREMFCFGVTGTNGKTSITYMIEAVLAHSKIPCGVLGTINHHLGEKIWSSEMTTPDPIHLQKRLREMKDRGAKSIAMEVSSHALEQHRADGVNFNTVVFTNLTRDHLDYHQNMKSYLLAKQRLFTDLLYSSSKPMPFAIVNTDDPWGAKLKVAGHSEVWSYGQKKNCDFRFEITKVDFARTDFHLWTQFGEFQSYLPMCGAHNVANAVAVVAAVASSGLRIPLSLEALTQFSGVPGRLQLVPNSKSLNVFVDYAHSPDALENVLKALNEVRKEMKSQARIWTVFGCGGDRDKGKRPMMAKEAIRYSDFVMVTSDNPRTEDPLHIIHDIMDGFTDSERKEKVSMEADRRKALQKVFSMAKAHDVILIAGKGHEDYQIIGETRHHFSDFETAKELLL